MSSNYTWFPKVIWDVENGETPEEDDVVEACEELHEAMACWGTEESTLVNVLGSKNAHDRFLIARQYEELYETPLANSIKGEVGGNLGRVLQLLSLNSVDAEARMVHDALKKGSESQLIPLMCGRSNPDMELLKKSYYRMYEEDMVQALTDNLSGDLEKLLCMCAQAIEENYEPDEVHTSDKIEADADAFYEAGQGSWGTDESEFFKILCVSPPEHLQAINAVYVEKYGYSMKKASQKELGGDTEDAVVYLLGIKNDEIAETLAKVIKKTCAGLGTDEVGLANFVVRLSVYPELFKEVMGKHEELFEKSVEDRIEGETSGEVKDILLSLCSSVDA